MLLVEIRCLVLRFLSEVMYQQLDTGDSHVGAILVSPAKIVMTFNRVSSVDPFT